MSTTKTIVPFFFAEVSEAGVLLIEQPEEYEKYIAANFSGKRVKVAVSKASNTRSYKQNNYYWGVIIPCAADAFGMHPTEAHHILGQQFLQAEVVDRQGKTRQIIRSTSDLTTLEAEDYFAKCREYLSAECSYYVPLPNEADWSGSGGSLKERA